MTTGPARGWFHWSQRDLRGIAEPKRADGEYEYALYLRQAGAGDELRANAEVLARFFDERHALRPNEIERLHGDISALLLPSAPRALDLDRAYLAIVKGQSFDKGRDALLAPASNAYERYRLGSPPESPGRWRIARARGKSLCARIRRRRCRGAYHLS